MSAGGADNARRCSLIQRRLRKGLVVLVAVGFAQIANAADVTVHAQQKVAGKHTRYSYSVTNQGKKTIVTILIGVDLNNRIPHLNSEPVGWDPLRSERIGYGLRIPSTGAAAPAGWIPIAMLFEERDRMAVGWIVTDNNASGVPPGATAAGFEVTVAAPDSEYVKSPFSVVFDDGTTASGRIAGEAF